MSNLTPESKVRKRASLSAWQLVGIVAGVLWLSVAPAADDAYLDLLNEEATKVEPVSTDTGSGDGQVLSGGSRPVPSRKRFEALLEEQHVGTFSFYRKLPARSREEVFLDYSNGASMDALREKIVDRYLHP